MSNDIFLSNEDREFENLLKKRFSEKWKEINSKDVSISDKEDQKLNITIENAIKYRRIIRIVSEFDFSFMTLRKLFFTLKEKEEISNDVIANQLEIDEDMINKIENGQKRGYSIPENMVAKILAKFQIKLKDFVVMLKNDLLINVPEKRIKSSYARTDSSLSWKKRDKHIKQGIDALYLELGKQNKNKNILVDEKYINKIKSILQNMNENNLLV